MSIDYGSSPFLDLYGASLQHQQQQQQQLQQTRPPLTVYF
jgi:hypothetical protein